MNLSPADKLSISDKLAQEYLRAPEWCRLKEDDVHSAQVAIRCVAARLGVYVSFNEAVEKMASHNEEDSTDGA